MISSLSRGPVTTFLLGVLGVVDFPVGDSAKPTVAYGWQGEPNGSSSYFIPWLELSAALGQPQRQQSMGDPGVDWKLAYNVYFAGVSRSQTEALADRIRNALVNLDRTNVIPTDTGDWVFMKVSVASIGSVQRIPSVYPDYYIQSDSYEAWLTKA